MADVVVVGLPGQAVDSMLDASEIPFEHADGDRLGDVLERSQPLLVLGSTTGGVPLAQEVHLLAGDVPVLLLADDSDDCEATSETLAISPGIGRHTRCLSLDDPDTARAVLDEVDRSRRRSEHHRTMVRVRSEIGALTSAPPETVSRYLGQLFDHAPIGILLADQHGVIRAANAEISRVLGWRPQQTVGNAFPDMFSGDHTALAVDLITDCVTAADAVVETLTRTGPEGSTQHLEVTVAPVDPVQTDLGVIILLRDESARLHALEVAERSRREAEDAADRYAKLAWTLQESLLPAELPIIAGAQIASRYHPAGDGSEIGGDFYDVFPVDDGEWLAVIGDVCGKGVGAARLTALSRYALRSAALRSASVKDNLEELNEALLRQYEEDRPRGEHRFTTAATVRFRPEGDGIAFTAGSGGHLPPLVVRADGRVEELACRGALLGMFADIRFVTIEERLAPGDALVLYTDGVTEARRGNEQLGEARLHDLLRHEAGRTADEIADAVQDAVLDFQAGTARDDTALLVIGPSRTGVVA